MVDTRACPLNGSMQRPFLLLAVLGLLVPANSGAQQTGVVSAAPITLAGSQSLFERVADNQKKNEREMDLYERIERLEIRKSGADPLPSSTKITRVIPAGTGSGRISLGPDGKPPDPAAYRAELERVIHSLAWAAEDGRAQRDAYERVAKKHREREQLINATRTAFIYTFVGREPRGDRMLTKYRIEPNPDFHPANRMEAIFTKVRGFVWVDEQSCQLARIEGDVTEDISIGLFLGRIYKGSHFMQDRYEISPGVWLPTFSQYDFDGRKFLSAFSIHERTFYTNYRRIGPPKAALPIIRAELDNQAAAQADP